MPPAFTPGNTSVAYLPLNKWNHRPRFQMTALFLPEQIKYNQLI